MKLIKTLLLTSAFAGVLTACNDIEPEDRFIPVEAVTAQRTVLLEEYTGQKCVNCPDGHAVISQLLGLYPDNFIPVSIHAGGDAFSIGEGQYASLVGLRTDDGEKYAEEAGVLSYPSGVTDRNTPVEKMLSWGTSLSNELQRPAVLDIKMLAALNSDGSAIDITTEVTPHSELNGNLQLWVVESGIVAMQYQPDGSKKYDYVHNHVFRATVNGHNGEPVSFNYEEPQTYTHSIAVKDNWNPENLTIVGFVYGANGVEQAAETHVIK